MRTVDPRQANWLVGHFRKWVRDRRRQPHMSYLLLNDLDEAAADSRTSSRRSRPWSAIARPYGR